MDIHAAAVSETCRGDGDSAGGASGVASSRHGGDSSGSGGGGGGGGGAGATAVIARRDPVLVMDGHPGFHLVCITSWISEMALDVHALHGYPVCR